jgi:hypothetical protein
MKQRKEQTDYENKRNLFLAEDSQPYQIELNQSNKLNDFLKRFHMDSVFNEYGDLVISGRRIC